MSTKVTIKHGAAYHLYSDALDEAFDDTGRPPAFVHLTLRGVHVQLDTSPDGGPELTLQVPRELAVELGLLPRA